MAATKQTTPKMINLSYDGDTYTLEFNRRQVERMESNGFSINALSEQPMTMIMKLVQGAFQMHHRGISADLVRDVWQAQTKRDELLGLLIRMYTEPLNTLMGDSDSEGAEENPTWTVL